MNQNEKPEAVLRAVGGTAEVIMLKTIRPDLVLEWARLPNPATIPPRPWLYGTIMMRGFTTVTVSPGGAGKTQLAMAMALAQAVGRPLLGHHIHHQVNAAIFNLEDPRDEMERRLAALMIHHRVSADEVRNKLVLHSGRDRPVCVAKISENGSMVVFPDKDAIIQECRRFQIAHLSVDPYVRTHELDENSNTHQAAAALAWAEIADAINGAVHLVHHTRKGAAVDIDASRGAKALTDHARAGLMLSAMPEEEADRLGIATEKRHSYVRLDDAKSNMAPKAEKAQWFHLAPVALGNGNADYPNGDTVTAIEPWKPPSVFHDTTPAQINAVLDILDGEFEPGVRFGATKRGASRRWAGFVCIRELGVTEGQAKQMIDTWIVNGLLYEEEFLHPSDRKKALGIRVNHTRRPS